MPAALIAVDPTTPGAIGGAPGPAAPKREFDQVAFYTNVGLLMAALLAGAVLVYLADRWRKNRMAPDRASAGTLSDFRALFEAGEITEAEYRVVRDRLAAQMKAGLPSGKPHVLTAADEAPADPTRLDPPAPT